MSKKLLIAVLTLGFLLTLSGAATSTGGPDQEWEVKPIVDPATFVDNPELSPMPLHSEAIMRPGVPIDPSAIRALPAGTFWPPPTDCELIDYTGGYYDIGLPVPYPSYDADVFMNLFTSSASGNIGGIVECTVKTATIGFLPDWSVGDPDMVVIVYDYENEADGSLNERGRVTIPFASLPAPGSGPSFIPVDLTTANAGGPVLYTDGARFRIGVTVTEPNTDTLFILGEDVPSYPGGSMMRFCSPSLDPPGCWWWFGPAGPQLNISAEVCCADLGFTDCELQYTNCPVEYIYLWNSPDWADYRSLWNQLFRVKGPDTLSAFGVATYISQGTGTPDLKVYVWGDNGGLPDESNLIYSTSRAYGSLVAYESAGGFNEFDVYSEGIVLREDFHIGVGIDPATWADGDTLAFITDDGYCGYEGSSMWIDRPDVPYTGWITFDEWYDGFDVNFKIYAYLCHDEFSLCQALSDYCADYYIYSLPNSGANGRIACYQRMDPIGIGCRLEKVKIMTYGWWDVPGTYLYPSDIEIRLADGVDGVPGTFLATKTINVGEYMDYPAWNEWDVTSLDLKFDQSIWVGIKTAAPWDQGVADYFVNADDASCPTGKAIGYYNDGVDEWWVYFDVNFWIEGEVCCIPPPERDCTAGQPDPDWPTAAHDFRRSGASYNSTGDAQCKQTLSWRHYDPAGIIYARPVIYDGIVLVPYNTKLQAFALAGDGTTPLWTITGLPYIGSNFRNSVTVKDGYVYFGGGNGRSFTKADVYLGPAGIVWSRNVLYPTPPAVGPAFAGNTTYSHSVILDCDGTEVVFVTTDIGEVYALDATTGLDYANWLVNPVFVDGNPFSGLSSNGSDVLYVSTDGALGTGNATFYAIEACTGDILWTLGEGTLYGVDLSGLANPGEFFRAGGAVDLDGSIYFSTAFNNTAGAPSGGKYRVDPAGNIVWGKGFKYTGFCWPVIDGNMVLFSGLRGWTSENNSVEGVDKIMGSTMWESDLFYNGSSWIEGALSCEPLEADIYYQGNRDWQFLAIDADEGDVLWEYNYVNLGSERGMGIAIDPTYLVMSNRQGEVYVFTEQVDRPRLRIMKFDEFVSVPFFSPDPYTVIFDDVFMNTGCANLTGTLTADEAAPAAYAWTVNPERIARMQDAADAMVDNTYADMASNLVKGQRLDVSTDNDFAESAYAKDSYSNLGAYAPPAWLNSIAISSFDLGQGDAFSVEYSVNGPLVTRGPQRCYVTISSNDQYFLNDPADPVVQLGVLGGCLEADDLLYFGETEQNEAPVHNTGEIGNQDHNLFYIDGNDARYWQGGLFYAADTYRLAFNVESWHGGDPADYWNSLLPDPNCWDQCEPYVTPDPIILGAISNDGGLTYDDIEGYATASAYIDSVINFDCYGTGWDWTNLECPYDNTLTMGIRVEEYMYGVIGQAGYLDHVVIYKYDITNRNADPVEVYVGAFNDFDLDGTLNGFDTYRFDATHSISWGTPCTPAYDFTNGVVYGMGKVPMDVDPMIGTRTCDANQAMWHADNIALDSMYYWMTDPGEAGQTAQAGIDINFPCDALSESDDRDAWHSFVGHAFGANETYSFASYFFGYENADVTDDQFWFDMAVMVNQFCGFGRGDIDNTGSINLADVVALWNMLHDGGPGPLFEHLADVNADGSVNDADVTYLANFWFCTGPAPVGDWTLPVICPAP